MKLRITFRTDPMMNRTLLLALVLSLPLPATAVDANWSGFATLGYAQSDKAYRYQRWIDDGGTLMRDSVVGGQLDLRFSPQWGAAIQGKIAPSDNHDASVSGEISWAFISWRPQDDVLVRLGKLRVPMMLNTENQDVGVTYDFARLPIEVYSIIPTVDFVGGSIAKSWFVSDLEWTLEAYAGQAKSHTRYYGREVTDTTSAPGSWFLESDVQSGGLVVSLRGVENSFRAGVHEARVSRAGGIVGNVPFVSLGPGIGYYDIKNGQRQDSFRIPVQSVGVSLMLPWHLRMISEFARMRFSGASEGLSRWGGYLALSRQFGDWTPYVSFAKTRSTGSSLRFYQDVDANTRFGPTLNNYQKLNADIIAPYDQWTGALGASYKVGAGGLLKAEWAQTNTGIVSSFVDAPSGGDSANKRINIFSFSYSLSF